MPEIATNILTDIHLQLLTILRAEVKPALEIVGVKIELLETLAADEPADAKIISETKEYILSSRKIVEEIIKRDETLIFGTENFTRRINLHSEFILASLHKYITEKHLAIVNRTEDLAPSYCSTALLKITVQRLLRYCIGLAKPGTCIKLESHSDDTAVSVQILVNKVKGDEGDIQDAGIQIAEKNNEFTIWTPCYQLLKFYRGNLWKEELEGGTLKVIMCIPTVKLNH